MVSPLLSRSEVFSFEPVLRARALTTGPIFTAVDGGAGWGDTARTILESTSPDGKVYAFEPFPGNHRFFEGCDSRIKLYKQAIADAVGSADFTVPRVVQTTDVWAEKGLAGYSSVGYLNDADDVALWRRTARKLRGSVKHQVSPTMQTLTVDVTTIAASVQEQHLDFVKLDLQGAEYKAIVGMGDLLERTDMLWVEFSNQAGLFGLLKSKGFIIFDTNYLCAGTSPEKLLEVGLQLRQELTLSTSQPAVLAMRLTEQSDYIEWFVNAQKFVGLYQTDFLCINPGYAKQFMKLLGNL